jgi:hypothetical protein
MLHRVMRSSIERSIMSPGIGEADAAFHAELAMM